MTTIGGAGGPGSIGGPAGPGGPGEADETHEIDAHGAHGAHGAAPEAAATRDVADVTRGAGVDPAQGPAAAGELARLSADVAAGRLSPREAVDRLVDVTAGPGLGAAERAELRELLTDLVANDPYLGGLIGRI